MTRPLVLITCVLALGACSPTQSIELAGPWSAEFEAAYEEAGDPFVRGVLEDGVVTDQEYAEMFEAFSSCMAAVGVTLREAPEADGGGISYTFPDSVTADEAHEAEVRCSSESGEYPIGALYHMVRRNPENLDEHEIVWECMIAQKIVAASYSIEDFARDWDESTLPFAGDETASEAFRMCVNDPLGLLG